MLTTTLKLADELKERIAPLANAAGQTAHAWMVAAIERQAALAEMHEQFIAAAQSSAAEVDAGAALYAAEDVHAYILARAAAVSGGKKPARPKPSAPAAPRSKSAKSAKPAKSNAGARRRT